VYSTAIELARSCQPTSKLRSMSTCPAREPQAVAETTSSAQPIPRSQARLNE